MDIPTVLAKFTQQMRQDITYPDMQKEILPRVVRFTRPAPGMSMVLFSDLNEANADAEIEEQIAFFTANQLPFSWKMYAYDSPPDLFSRLQAHGFTPDPPDALMALDLAEVSVELLKPSAVDVRRIERDQLADVVTVLQQVWGGDFAWIHARHGAHLAVPDYLSIYVAYVADAPACAGWAYYPPGSEFASLWGGSTIPAMRNTGLYTAVLSARVQEAIRRGRHYLVIDAGFQSRPIVERHGFIYLTDVHACDYTGLQAFTGENPGKSN
ncbi:MAG: GNAT family N-acetyltransferase [Bellilinea sp.]